MGVRLICTYDFRGEKWWDARKPNILTTYVKLGDTQAWAIQTISFFFPSHVFLLVCNYKRARLSHYTQLGPWLNSMKVIEIILSKWLLEVSVTIAKTQGRAQIVIPTFNVGVNQECLLNRCVPIINLAITIFPRNNPGKEPVGICAEFYHGNQDSCNCVQHALSIFGSHI